MTGLTHRRRTVSLALDHVLHVLLRRPGDKVSRVTASAVVTEMLHLQAVRDGFDPELVGDAMHDRPVARCCFDTSVPACARVKVFWIAAEQVVASAPYPMPLRDWSHPELIGQSVRPI
jgi:hypothetical protein